MRLLILLLLVGEIYLGLTVVRVFGFWAALAAYVLPTMLALPFFTFQNHLILSQFQRQLALGRTPDKELMHLVLKFIGFVLLLVPSLLSRIMGLILLFPMTRHSLVWMSKSWIEKKVAQGSFRIFNGSPGFGGAGTYSFRYGQYRGPQEEPRTERDAKVIDIEALHLPPSHSDVRDP